jgi:2-oxoglutarate dehydrogenase E2 component (dihydrolipoamide succinyltransferase)
MSLRDVIRIPKEFPQDETVRVAAACAADGDAVAAGQTVLELEFSKAALELPSPSAGFVRLLCAEGDDVPVGAAAAEIHDSRESALARPAPAAAARPEAGAQPFLSAKAEELVLRRGLDTGPLAHLGLVRSADLVPAPADPIPAAPAPAGGGEPLPRAKLAEIAALAAGQNALASGVEVLVRLPGPADQAALGGLRSLFTPRLLTLLCGLLKRFPALNGFYADGAAHFHPAVNLGYALDMDLGLRVAALGDLDGASPEAARDAVMDKIRRYMRGRLAPADMQGVTFTVSDLSGEGVDSFIPLIGAGQSAILGVCSPDEAGRARLVLRFDHRMLEGRAAARFLNALKTALEAQRT